MEACLTKPEEVRKKKKSWGSVSSTQSTFLISWSFVSRKVRNMISVIICTYNRAHSLHEALHSLSVMSVPADLSWEILVIDNNSHDRTKEVVADFAKASNVTIRYVFESTQGLNHARNRGVKEAAGEIVSFLDDDIIVAQDWLAEIDKAFNAFPVVCVGGRVLLKPDLHKPDWWNEVYDGVLGKFDYGDAVFLPDETYSSIVGIGANLSFKRLLFDKYGFFRPDLGRRGRKLLMGEEVEFYDRLRAGGEKTMYYPHAVVYHCPDVGRITYQYLCRWHFRIGEWRVLRENPQETREVSFLLGVPRWRYRLAIEHGFRAVTLAFKRQRKEALFNTLQFITFLGYFCGSLKQLLAALRKSPPFYSGEHVA